MGEINESLNFEVGGDGTIIRKMEMCPHCKKETDSDGKYCKHCGKKIKAGSKSLRVVIVLLVVLIGLLATNVSAFFIPSNPRVKCGIEQIVFFILGWINCLLGIILLTHNLVKNYNAKAIDSRTGIIKRTIRKFFCIIGLTLLSITILFWPIKVIIDQWL